VLLSAPRSHQGRTRFWMPGSPYFHRLRRFVDLRGLGERCRRRWSGDVDSAGGQQFQSRDIEPVYVLFEDFTHVKFYRRSFFDVVEDEGGRFDGFRHVDDWVPQRLVTATGPNPLPR